MTKKDIILRDVGRHLEVDYCGTITAKGAYGFLGPWGVTYQYAQKVLSRESRLPLSENRLGGYTCPEEGQPRFVKLPPFASLFRYDERLDESTHEHCIKAYVAKAFPMNGGAETHKQSVKFLSDFLVTLVLEDSERYYSKEELLTGAIDHRLSFFLSVFVDKAEAFDGPHPGIRNLIIDFSPDDLIIPLQWSHVEETFTPTPEIMNDRKEMKAVDPFESPVHIEPPLESAETAPDAAGIETAPTHPVILSLIKYALSGLTEQPSKLTITDARSFSVEFGSFVVKTSVIGDGGGALSHSLTKNGQEEFIAHMSSNDLRFTYESFLNNIFAYRAKMEFKKRVESWRDALLILSENA